MHNRFTRPFFLVLIHQAITLDSVVLRAEPLLQNGLLDAARATANPQLLDELTTLMRETLARYRAVVPAEKVTKDAEALIIALEKRPYLDMTPYVTRLRAAFPKAE